MYSFKQEFKKLRNKEYDLLHPERWSSVEEERYEKYIESYTKNTDFHFTVDNNDAKFNKPMRLKSAAKEFGFAGWAIVAIMAYMGAWFANDAYDNKVAPAKSIVWEQKTNGHAMALFTVFGCLLGMCMGLLLDKHLIRDAREYNVKDMYNRLSLYLFDALQATNPELDKDILKKYNSSLAEIVTELLIANMDKSDTEQLRAIAIDLMNQIEADQMDLTKYKAVMANALDIVKKALRYDSDLYHTMVLVFKGWAPAEFDLAKNKQKKMIYLLGNKVNQQ